MLKVRLENDLIQTKSVRWDLSGRRALRAQGRWPERFFKKAVIGKGVQLMTLMGSGDVFIARDKQDHDPEA